MNNTLSNERVMDSSRIMQEEPYLIIMVLLHIQNYRFLTIKQKKNKQIVYKDKFWLILYIRFTSRVQFQNYSPYKLIIHC